MHLVCSVIENKFYKNYWNFVKNFECLLRINFFIDLSQISIAKVVQICSLFLIQLVYNLKEW